MQIRRLPRAFPLVQMSVFKCPGDMGACVQLRVRARACEGGLLSLDESVPLRVRVRLSAPLLLPIDALFKRLPSSPP